MVVSLPNIRLAYYPVPKCANTSIKLALHKVKFGAEFEPSKKFKHIHRLHPTPSFSEIRSLDYCGFLKVAVIRDPISRFISAWSNRVAFHRELSQFKLSADQSSYLVQKSIPFDPDLEAFIEHLEEYRFVSASIRAHTDTLTHYLGEDPSFFHALFRIDQLHLFEKLILSLWGNEVVFPREQTGGTKRSVGTLSPQANAKLRRIYENDYKVFGESLNSSRPAIGLMSIECQTLQ